MFESVSPCAGRTVAIPPYAIIRLMFPPLRRIFRQLSGRSPAAQSFLANRSGLLVCILFLLVGLAAAGDYGINYDEMPQRRIARANLDYIRGHSDRIATDLYQDRVYSVAFELPLLLAERVLGLADYSQIHRLRLTLTHLFFIVGAYFGWQLAYRLFGSRPLAMLALLFLLLHPRIYGHSFVNFKDLPFLSMFLIALYLLERAFRKDTAGAFLLLGAAVGLLTNLRIMGLMLVAAPLAMRGLDGFYAGNWPERKRILLTAGLFALTAGLTLYAATPYAWANPVDYLTTSLGQTVNHPAVLPQLFQGELLLSNELPPHYTAVWFGITTPPLILLLGCVGMAAVMIRGIRRPGTVFRNTRMRFLLLLLACFLLPPLAATVLGSNQSEGWRHLFFIYAPFSLLAAYGGGWLAAALYRQGRWMAGGYGLAGVGLGLAALQLAQIHPLQPVYFNFLAERTTPERLRTQYDLDYMQLAHRAGLEYLRQRHPGETLTVRVGQRHLGILPAAARERLRPATGGRNADYELIYPLDSVQPDLAFNAAYRHRLYNNTLIALRPLDAARMTPAAIAAYQEIYRQAVAGEPIIRADYKVYLADNRLTFIRENCPPGGRDEWFGVKPFPAAEKSLPPYSRQAVFYAPYYNHRVRLGDVCLAVIQLPADIAGDLIITRRDLGNFGPAALPLWEELYTLAGPSLREKIARLRQRQPPANPDAFAVFLDRDDAGRPRLLYAKAGCTQSEYETRVILHITPADLADLPAYNRGNSFDNRDFLLDVYGGRPGGDCIAAIPLPAYPIAEIRTGQAGRWETNLYPPANPDDLRMAYAALSDIQPAIQADFDLYVQDNRLIYLRETCNAGDTAANFFLHILPQDVADLPAERQAAGFANRDFAFGRYGGSFDGKCLAAIPLPDYPIASIRTGQHRPGPGELWAAEVAVGR